MWLNWGPRVHGLPSHAVGWGRGLIQWLPGVGGDPLETHPPEAHPRLSLDVAAVPPGEWPKRGEGGDVRRKEATAFHG